ncbi:alpha/beta hydrolase [Rhodocytophaga aerolata]|uniref:Alpha/beta hydrolase n=1 Tax=Rhodocytophaga aerolata TaxID=455078 RepID=A0ABT8R2P0_9BACT|nr:alpha/beta hydrolase [Rhodocytophaga aerolata]MDO1445538.1 alpha/beta hydrolase [Rhodocytophaga aerolata]
MWNDLAYASVSAAQKLDIRLPATGKGPFPVIVAIHGGAFRTGDKGDVQLSSVFEGVNRGYAVVSINYRLSGEAKSPKMVHDVKAAIRWVRAHAQTYNIDKNKIAVWGPSAGGHLAALLGTSGDVAELEDLSLGNPEESSRVQAVVDWFGPINFLTMDDQFHMLGVEGMLHNTPDSPESAIIGKPITQAAEEVKLIDPQTYISADCPPFFIQHGTKDPLIPYLQSVVLADALYKVIGKEKVQVALLEGAGHGGSLFDDPENLHKVYAFLDKHLKR